LGPSKSTKTFDAGEPNFTAGKPILNAILSEGLTNVLVVVARWFGGTKLGKGNLAKAYREAAYKVLSETEKIEKFITREVEFQFEVDKFNLVQSILRKFKAEIVEKRFERECKIRARVPEVKFSLWKEKLVEATSGKIKFK
jgi:putative IMPACT (imprinted ancient) family translation regulator